mgnify:CR=1 FL=1
MRFSQNIPIQIRKDFRRDRKRAAGAAAQGRGARGRTYPRASSARVRPSALSARNFPGGPQGSSNCWEGKPGRSQASRVGRVSAQLHFRQLDRTFERHPIAHQPPPWSERSVGLRVSRLRLRPTGLNNRRTTRAALTEREVDPKIIPIGAAYTTARRKLPRCAGVHDRRVYLLRHRAIL